MAKKKSSSSSSSNATGHGKGWWAFWAVVIAGATYLIIYLVNIIVNQLGGNSGLMNTVARVITAVCSLIAWTIVAVLGWNLARNRQTIWKVVYIVCVIAIYACALLPALGIGL